MDFADELGKLITKAREEGVDIEDIINALDSEMEELSEEANEDKEEE